MFPIGAEHLQRGIHTSNYGGQIFFYLVFPEVLYWFTNEIFGDTIIM